MFSNFIVFIELNSLSASEEVNSKGCANDALTIINRIKNKSFSPKKTPDFNCDKILGENEKQLVELDSPPESDEKIYCWNKHLSLGVNEKNVWISIRLKDKIGMIMASEKRPNIKGYITLSQTDLDISKRYSDEVRDNLIVVMDL